MNRIQNTPNNLFFFIKNHKQPSKLYFHAFTLVELIVVIVILAILATIAFLSFNSYSSSARDSTRLADVSNLNKGVELYQVNAGYYPTPEGTISTGKVNGVDVTYKGIIGDRISKMVNINKTPVDPLSTSNYVYGISYDKKYFQIGIVLESGTNKTSYLNKHNVISSLSRNPFLSLIGYNTSLDNNSIGNSIPHLTSPNTGEELISSIFPLTRGNTRGLFDIEQTYSASGAGNYFSKIKGNYNGIIKFSTGTTNKIYYIANIPSLLYNDTNPNLLNTGTYYVVNNNTNLPYQISPDTTTNNKTADVMIQEINNSPTATLTGIDITAIVNSTGTTSEINNLIASTFTGITLSSFGGNIGVVTSTITNGTTTSAPTPTPVSNDCAIGNYSNTGTQTYSLTGIIVNTLSLTGSATVTIPNGNKTYAAKLTCNTGIITISNESVINNCDSGYNWSGIGCVAIPSNNGASSSSPGLSCKNIKNNYPSLVDGTYRIKPDSNAAFQVYCDMANDGGGWTLVMRGKGGEITSCSTQWDNVNDYNLGNSTSFGSTFKFSDAKINAIKGSVGFRVSNDDKSVKRYWKSDCTYVHTTAGGVNNAPCITSYTSTSRDSPIVVTGGPWARRNGIATTGPTILTNYNYFPNNGIAYIMGSCDSNITGCNMQFWVK